MAEAAPGAARCGREEDGSVLLLQLRHKRVSADQKDHHKRANSASRAEVTINGWSPPYCTDDTPRSHKAQLSWSLAVVV